MLVVLRKSAAREIEELPEEYYSRIKKCVLSLADDPFPRGTKKLTSRELYRIRVGPYRIVYEVDKARKTVTVNTVRHRKEVYRR